MNGADDEHLTGDAETVRQVFEAFPRIMVALEGPDLVFAAANRFCRQWAGRQQLVGRPAREVFPDVLGQRIVTLIDRAMRTGESLALRDFRHQIADARTGTRTELVSDIDTVFFYWPDGSVRGIILDITTAQQRLADADDRRAQANDAIEQLQRELLPAGVPVLPRVQLAASCLFAGTSGGDWYDAFPLDDGRVALVVGDVVGHGVTATATMGQLRVLVRDRLSEAGDLLAAVAAADAMTNWTPAARAATLCAVVLDPPTSSLRYCTAGHPPPLLLPSGGGYRYLTPTGGGPLGTGTHRALAESRVEERDMLLLYTDGILERPGRSLAESTVELAQVAADIAAAFQDTTVPVQQLTSQTVELLTGVTRHTDDITLLAAQLTTVPAGADIEIPADTKALDDFRAQFGQWLREIHAPDIAIDKLQHAVGELVTNAIEHPHLDSPDAHTVRVYAHLDDHGAVRIQVADDGRWREPMPSPDRGLGLPLAAKLVDTFVVEHGATGTTAHADLRLTRPAQLIAAPAWAPAADAPHEADPFLVLDQPFASTPAIRVDGPVDATTAPALDRALGTATAAGTRSLSVDLTGVSHLASAGVAVLHHHYATAAANHTDLRLHSPAGSPAALIMTLVDLPYDTHDLPAGPTKDA
ncbi:anti-anti-sigma factor [Kibdelosporangium banguiense]|uniref:Anti-anti-sigma factor n=1 Tax=Kibdelosporangium banguiense TaxID=1365924 RepID=A0ABS4U1X0_9PSEU|nr:SpoIIE family protein phosphatase [Kibdelosporangium banguiense]MBP2330662.1 anti-anti-sigma factor [Kibdelosporangium banguiense]